MIFASLCTFCSAAPDTKVRIDGHKTQFDASKGGALEAEDSRHVEGNYGGGGGGGPFETRELGLRLSGVSHLHRGRASLCGATGVVPLAAAAGCVQCMMIVRRLKWWICLDSDLVRRCTDLISAMKPRDHNKALFALDNKAVEK
jgi:hypothetical protein